MESAIITKENTFASKKNISSISEYKNCLEKFADNFSREISLDTKSVIFLDTNVILRYYSISFTARHKLFDFIKKYSDRIVISAQVQAEFLKNREDVIQRFFEQVTNKIPKDFNSDIINKSKNFLEQHKVVLKDYPFVESGISQSHKDLETLLDKLNETIDKKREEHLGLILKDDFLDLLTRCTLYSGLTPEEYLLVKNEFDELKKQINIDSMDTLLNKPNAIFPGLGDIREKPDDPYGDYIIYHEMIKFMITRSADVLFLTFDNSKGDWMSKKKSPHLNYVLNSFLNTGQLLYIIDAERTLGELLDVNIDSLISDQVQTEDTSITIESLTKIVETLDVFKHVRRGKFTQRTLDELKINGYSSILEVEKDLIKASIAVKKYAEDQNPDLNTIGILRVALRIANSAITKFISLDGKLKDLPNLDEYEKYRGMLI
jgi:hypothetical protein